MPRILFTAYTEQVRIGDSTLVLRALPAGFIRFRIIPLREKIQAGSITEAEILDEMADIVAAGIVDPEPWTVRDVMEGLTAGMIADLYGRLVQLAWYKGNGEKSEGEASSPKS